MNRNISEICLEIGKIVKRSGASSEACNKVDDLLVEINEVRNEENSFWRKQMEAAYERGKSNFWKKQLEDMQEKTRLIDANAFIRSLDNYKGKPFTPGLCATLVELFPATCDTEAYQRGRADAIEMFLNAIKTYDTYGYEVDELGEGNYLVKLNSANEKDFVPYIHLDDVIKCAEGVLKEQR